MSESLLTAGADSTEAAPTTTATNAPAGDSILTGEQAASQAPAAEGAKADGGQDGGEKAPEGAPEAYADFTIPEGIELKADLVDEAKGLAKALNLPQDKAQEVVGLAAKAVQQHAEAQASTVQSIHDGWIAEVKADPELLAGDGFDANLAKAKAAMEATTTPQLRMLLGKSGLGNNVEVIRHFLKIAPAFAEDKHVPGGTPAGSGKTAAQVLYDSTN